MTVVEWVALRPIFEVCEKETGYKGGGRVHEQWWRQTTAERHLKTTLKEILVAAWDRQKREYGRSGEGKGGEEESDSGGDG